MADELTIVANGQSIKGWQDVSVVRSIEGFPSSFDVGFIDRYPTSDEIVTIVPGTACQVMIGGDKVLTGYVDAYQSQITPQTHDCRVSGRSKCEDAADCSAYGGEHGEGTPTFMNMTLVQIAQELLKPFAIQVINKTDDSPPITLLVVNLGETPYDVIEKAARWAGVLVYDDVDGNLVLDRVGSQSMGSGFTQGVNVEAASVSLRADARFSDYYVVWQATNSQQDNLAAAGGGDSANLHGYAQDPGLQKLGRYRPHYIVSALVDVDLGKDLGPIIAQWEANRRWGRSMALQLTTNSWRDKDGMLWQPNARVSVDLPILRYGDLNWVIGTVTFKRNLQSGTTADLVLYPPEAFSVEPLSLSPADADRVTAIRQAQDQDAHRVSVETEGMDATPQPTTTETPIS